MAHTLYRMFDRDGILLYVGISKRPLRRFDEHGRDKSWWDDVARVDVEHFPSRAALEVAERIAIRAEGPLHNKQRYGAPALEVPIPKSRFVAPPGITVNPRNGHYRVRFMFRGHTYDRSFESFRQAKSWQAATLGRLEWLWAETERIADETGLGMAGTFAMIRNGQIDEAESHLAQLRTGATC